METEFQDYILLEEDEFFSEAAIRSGLPNVLKPLPVTRPLVVPKTQDRSLPEQHQSVPRDGSSSKEMLHSSKSRLTRDNYVLVLQRLKGFVELALSSKERPMVRKLLPGYRLSFDLSELAKEHLGLFPVMVDVAGRFSDQNRYDEFIELFRDACKENQLFKCSTVQRADLWGRSEVKLLSAEMSACAEVFNRFVETLRRLGVENDVKQRRCERLRDAKERYEGNRKYVNELFSLHRRLVVVRLDLAYHTSLIEHSMSAIRQHFDVFLKNQRSKPKLFDGLVGYIAKFEYGVERGPHIHLIIFFDGGKRRNRAYHFAKCIGEYWEGITLQRGTYFNCHVNDRTYHRLKRLGVGMIRADDLQKRERFEKYVLSYLCKSDSFAHPNGLGGFRSMRRGVPRKKK